MISTTQLQLRARLCSSLLLPGCEAGSMIGRGDETVHVAIEATELVETTGAGDTYVNGRSLAECGRAGIDGGG
jgi:sugar/nucleoside kinase (ribokinase family)